MERRALPVPPRGPVLGLPAMNLRRYGKRFQGSTVEVVAEYDDGSIRIVATCKGSAPGPIHEWWPRAIADANAIVAALNRDVLEP
jgi:hypothetical protein